MTSVIAVSVGRSMCLRPAAKHRLHSHCQNVLRVNFAHLADPHFTPQALFTSYNFQCPLLVGLLQMAIIVPVGVPSVAGY